MSVLTIDTFTTALDFNESVPLEGTEYLFDFAWNDRDGYWYLTISDQDANQIANGIKLLININLLRRFTDTRLPPGLLMCVDLTGTATDIVTSGELGYRVPLLYTTSDDPTITGKNLRNRP